MSDARDIPPVRLGLQWKIQNNDVRKVGEIV